MAQQNYNDMPKLAKQYLYHLITIKGLSPNTSDAYAIDLRNFFRFLKRYKLDLQVECDQDVDIHDIDLEFIKQVSILDVYEYLNYVMSEHENSAKTRARKVSSLRGFFKFLTSDLRLLKENPVEHLETPKIKQILPKYLTVDQSKQLLQKSTSSNKDSKTLYRNYCILTLFLNCGMRLSELVQINLSDFDLTSGRLILLGKGNKEREIFLNSSCKLSIDNYLTNERALLRKIVDQNALFLSSRSGKRLCARQVQNIVSQALEQAGLDHMGFSTHKLRHTAATLLYQYGHVDILLLKELLGHANVGTTQIYTHVANEAIQKTIEKNPLANQTIDVIDEKEEQ